MSAEDQQRWDEKYSRRERPRELAPDPWLQNVSTPLPPGRALELACGLGHNAIWLAQKGWRVDAVDISPVGLRLAADLAGRHGVAVNWIAADLDEFTPDEATYNLISVFRFLDRARLPRMIERALCPGGILIYETFSAAHLVRADSHMKNPAFILADGELPRLFPSLDIVSYTACDLADRTVARLVARRTSGSSGVRH